MSKCVTQSFYLGIRSPNDMTFVNSVEGLFDRTKPHPSFCTLSPLCEKIVKAYFGCAHKNVPSFVPVLPHVARYLQGGDSVLTVANYYYNCP